MTRDVQYMVRPLKMAVFLLFVHPLTLSPCCACPYSHEGCPDASAGKESTSNAGDTGDVGSTSGSGRSPEGEHGKPILQYSCLENSIDRGAWRAAVLGVTKIWT